MGGLQDEGTGRRMWRCASVCAGFFREGRVNDFKNSKWDYRWGTDVKNTSFRSIDFCSEFHVVIL